MLSNLAPEGLAISVISYMEAFQGTLRTGKADAGAKLAAFVATVPVLRVDVAIAEQCARIREDLRAAGKRPTRRGLDLLIAATAIRFGLTLVTRNIDDFADIPGIKVYQDTA